jgi:hypothetical protein
MPLTYHNTRTGRTVRVPTPDEAAAKSSAPKRARRRQEKLLTALNESNRWMAGESSGAEPRSQASASRAGRAVQRDLDIMVGQRLAAAEAAQPVQHGGALAEGSGVPHTPAAEASSTEPTPAVPDVPEAVPEPSLADVRVWAETAGIEVSARGRISKDVIDAYKQAHADGGS